MSARSSKSRKPAARRPTHRLPIGLQIAARLFDGADMDANYLKARLADADCRALRLLTDPLVSFEAEGPNVEIARMAESLGSEEARARLEAAVPETATHDPGSWVTDAIMPFQSAGYYVGLCLGWRLATSICKDGGDCSGCR